MSRRRMPQERAPSASLLLVIAIVGASCGGTKTPTGPSTPAVALTVSVNPTTLVGGNAVEGTVTLSAAPSAAAAITLTSSNPAAATVPGTVSIQGGSTSATFSVSTSQVPTPTTVTIRGANGTGATGSADLVIQQIPTCGPFLNAKVAMPFVVYTDDGDPRNHFIPSGFFGDVADLTISTDRTSPQSGSSALKIAYVPRGPQWFAGVFFECGGPFGTVQNQGFDLSLAHQVTFFARSSSTSKAEFKVGGISGPFPDSFASTSTSPAVVDLGTDWRQFTIDMSGQLNLTRVIGGFMVVTNTTQNPTGAEIFVDEIFWR